MGPAGPAGERGPQGPAGDGHWTLASGAIFLEDESVGIGTSNPLARLDVRGDVRATSFAYSAPRSKRITISGDVFQPTTIRNERANFRRNLGYGGAAFTAGEGGMVASVPVPDGALIESVKFHYFDDAPGDITFTLSRLSMAFGGYQPLGRVESAGAPGFGDVTLRLDAPEPVDLGAGHAYQVRAFSTGWSGSSLRVMGVTVTWSVVAPD